MPEKSYKNIITWAGRQYGLVGRAEARSQNSGNSVHSQQTVH